MGTLRTVYHLFAYYFSFVLFGAVGFVLNLGCLLLAWLPAQPGTDRFFQKIIHVHFKIWVHWLFLAGLVEVNYPGFERMPAKRLVIAANHPGLMDVTFLLARISEAICVFKPSIARNPVLGSAARRAGYLINTGGLDLLRSAVDKVAAGNNLIVFPEGTRSQDGMLGPLKPGFVLIAQRAKASVQLVSIRSTSSILAKGDPWWRLPRLPARVEITLGPLLAPDPEERPAVLVKIAQAWFTSEINRPMGAPGYQ